jgi:tRNA pseudouridine32 synthase/23S rRNA pseudouridine746 synthase
MTRSHIPYVPPHSSPELVYHDEHLVVANKPAGLLAVPGRGADKSDCLTTRLQQLLPDALSVHRLDMSTSGLLVFARSAEMHRLLSRMFREREVQKRYVAIVAGLIENASGEVELPLSADWPSRPRQKVDKTTGKHSLTRYQVLCRDVSTDTTRVELEPVTGRTHQLRVHMAAIGHPIVGDALYGGSAAERLMLHASRLSFVHPVSAAPLTLMSEAPF